MSKRSRNKYIERKKKKKKVIQRSLKYYPVMFCLEEQICIGISHVPMKFKADRFGRIKTKEKISKKHWQDWECSFREKKYKVDLFKYKKGDLIKCPFCNSSVDFRLFPSSFVPKFSEIKNDKIIDS